MATMKRLKMSTESVEILPFPGCLCAMNVCDRGYTTFNPGMATCTNCRERWDLGNVRDVWEAIEIWNKRQPQYTDAAMKKIYDDEMARRNKLREQRTKKWRAGKNT